MGVTAIVVEGRRANGASRLVVISREDPDLDAGIAQRLDDIPPDHLPKHGATCARSNRSPRMQKSEARCSIAHRAAFAKFPWRSNARSEIPVSGSIRKSKLNPSWTSPTQTISCILACARPPGYL